MPAVTFPRRVTSTATTIAVNSATPAWLPAKGYWSGTIASGTSVSLNTADSIKSQYLPLFTSTRNFWRLWNDYSGAVWNPHIGTYGAMLFGPGGGHTDAIGQAGCDNGVYMWRADTRQWSRLSDCSYPGMLSDADWDCARSYPWDSDLMNTYGEVSTNVPCSSHNRSLPCIIPPTWGGAQGSLCIPYLAAMPGNGNYSRPQAHALNCDTAIAVGSSAASQFAGGAWSRLGGLNPVSNRGWAATVDTTRGYVYLSNNNSSYDLSRINLGGSPTWANVTPSGYGSAWGGTTLQYAKELDLLIHMNRSLNLALIPAGGSPLAMTLKTTANAPAIGYDEFDTSGTGFVWCKDLGSNGALVHFHTTAQESNPATWTVVKVYACYAPADPLTGTWTWAELQMLNFPSSLFRSTAYLNNYLWYNRFQYSEVLKSFFLCTQPDDAYGGILCFRPLEIP